MIKKSFIKNLLDPSTSRIYESYKLHFSITNYTLYEFYSNEGHLVKYKIKRLFLDYLFLRIVTTIYLEMIILDKMPNSSLLELYSFPSIH